MDIKDSFLDTPVSYKGTNYTPVSHRLVVETIEQYLDSQNKSIVKESYIIKAGGQKVLGKLMLESVDDSLNQMLAWKNSLDGQMSFQVVAGNMVFVCNNGLISSDEFSFKRKHTGDAVKDIIEAVKHSLSIIDQISENNIKRREKMKNIHITKYTMSELLGRIFVHENILTPTQANIVRHQIVHPEHNYGGGDTLWDFFNHCTYALKESHPLNWHKKHVDLSKYFENRYLSLLE